MFFLPRIINKKTSTLALCSLSGACTLVFFSIVALMLSLGIFRGYASSSDISISIDTLGTENVLPGSIISVQGDKYVLSIVEYDGAMFGVISGAPALALLDINLEEYAYLSSTGEHYVRVSTINGPIEKGNYITSSSIVGVGQLATRSGQILGIALEDYSEDSSEQIGEILVSVNPTSVIITEDISPTILETLRAAFNVPFITPLTTFRFILAAFVALLTFAFGFISFGRISSNSIEALGRNPLAGRIIKSAIFMNFILTMTIIVVGLFISYLIITL